MAASQADPPTNNGDADVSSGALTKTPAAQGTPDPRKLAALLQLEADIRRQTGVNELQYFVANEVRAVLPYGQIFVLKLARVGEKFEVVCASSLATVDRQAPLIQAIEKTVVSVSAKMGLDEAQGFDPNAVRPDEALNEYPFRHFHWSPLKDKEGQVFAGLLITREEPLKPGEAFLAGRLAETAGHAWLALSGGKPVRRWPAFTSKCKKWIAAALVLALLFPVRLTVLAPAEIVAQRPYVVAAPFSGRIASIEVTPNAPVEEGQVLLRFDDVRLSNELELATEKLSVARSRLDRSTSSAFSDDDETSDIAIMRAEVEVAEAELDYAKQLAGQSAITAERSGMALFSDRRDWEGRTVNIGDPIMQVVDPDQVMIRIDLPAAEQLTLKKGGKVKMWLDSQPLWAIDGVLETASYQASQTPEGTLAFAITAKLDGDSPRIGSRGTAQVYGRWVPFAYSLLRRPISALRQFIGL